MKAQILLAIAKDHKVKALLAKAEGDKRKYWFYMKLRKATLDKI